MSIDKSGLPESNTIAEKPNQWRTFTQLLWRLQTTAKSLVGIIIKPKTEEEKEIENNANRMLYDIVKYWKANDDDKELFDDYMRKGYLSAEYINYLIDIKKVSWIIKE